MSQGVVQSFSASAKVTTLDGATQTIPLGPVASQEAIKMLGTNGGGFFNANSAHPYENPTPATNLLEMLLIFAIPAGLTYTLGSMTGKLAPRLGGLRGDEPPLPRRRGRHGLGRDAGQPDPSRRRGRRRGREHGGEGGPLRRGRHRPLRHDHDRRVVRRRERDARLLHARSAASSRSSTSSSAR